MEVTATKKGKRGGVRPNSGRPKGKKDPHTLEKEKVQEAVKLQILGIAKHLVNSQAVNALGSHLFVQRIIDIEEVEDEDGEIEEKETVRERVIRDTDKMQEIMESGVYGEDYIFVQGSRPDWKAANALLDRGLGKAVETLDLGNKDGQPLIIKLD